MAFIQSALGLFLPKCSICKELIPGVNGKAQHLTIKIMKQEEYTAGEKKVWAVLETIPDPEIPVLQIVDLGMVRNVKISDDGIPEITITSTYTGCPAMDFIAAEIKLQLTAAGFSNPKIINSVSPAWTTDWMSEHGKRKLKEYGIAPPQNRSDRPGLTRNVICPQCNSNNTKVISEFGSTACKALYQCNDCKEPFDYFKCH
jgi:ring-1,2-phenylacetyl-CoA epoxidase subunit PaaD